jgi:hypothetical protein
MQIRSTLLLLLLGCGKAASPSADCDAFATGYATKLATPSDGELTKKAIQVEALTLQNQCHADKWSAELTRCVLDAPKGTDISKKCPFTPDQAQHLNDRRRQQADDLRDAIKSGLGTP